MELSSKLISLILKNIVSSSTSSSIDLFNASFEETGKELVQKFKFNFQRLREFMEAVDKEIGSMTLFNKKEDRYAGDTDGFNENGKYGDITSVQ